ncbi:universal stress protein [Nonomuraea sp. 3-1Str]|uniref:universal stress protein n=1 Tax=Nonomuraea sp. 3-1Str TaxID=2929801 RepID=UPI0028560893|nr:universal stress protein [Nonomuraea sp. 3-1Str]MDR8412540.1 universal stress protein [Nonomuraea sp. 3-1Str]
MAGRIVVGVDGSAPSTAAVEWAAVDARRRGLALRVVHVCEQWGPPAGSTEYCSAMLETAADRARALAPDADVSSGMLSGGVIDALVGESILAESMVLGSRGLGGFAGMVLGSVSMAVAGHAACPVVVVRRTAVVQHGQVVVGYDGSEHSQAAMEYAVEQARARNAQLHVLYAWQMPVYSPYATGYGGLIQDAYQQEVRMAAERVVPWREKNPDIRIVDDQVCEHPVSALMKAALTADLVVIGSRGLGGFVSAVLGSVSHGVLHHVACPVAVVRPRKERTWRERT